MEIRSREVHSDFLPLAQTAHLSESLPCATGICPSLVCNSIPR